MKHIITSALLTLSATAFISCEPEPDPTPTPNAPSNTDTDTQVGVDLRTDFEKLSDDVASEVLDAEQCKFCHETQSVTELNVEVTSRLIFDELTGEAAVNGLTAFITLDNPANVAIAKQKPNGLLQHFGGDKLGQVGNEAKNEMWSEFVDQVAAMNPPVVGSYSEILTYVTDEIITTTCVACHSNDSHLSPSINNFVFASTSETDVEAGITTYLESKDIAKTYLLGKPNGLFGHQGLNAINNDSDKLKNWNALIENLSAN